jgi:signal transduction histidine kinase
LHPAVLDDYGLAKAIEWYTQVFERQAGIATMFSIVGEPVSITGAPATHCFRIVQEALNNVARHSGALSVQVEMIFTRTSLTISVKDSGKGIAREKSADKPGLGLIAMRERAEILSGELQVTSAASNGTTVTLVVPISHDELPDTNSTELVGELK